MAGSANAHSAWVGWNWIKIESFAISTAVTIWGLPREVRMQRRRMRRLGIGRPRRSWGLVLLLLGAAAWVGAWLAPARAQQSAPATSPPAAAPAKPKPKPATSPRDQAGKQASRACRRQASPTSGRCGWRRPTEAAWPIWNLGRLHGLAGRQESLLRARQANRVGDQSAEPAAQSGLHVHF